jgi:hypothetical protein
MNQFFGGNLGIKYKVAIIYPTTRIQCILFNIHKILHEQVTIDSTILQLMVIHFAD